MRERFMRRLVVGLIIIFALLFFCAGVAMLHRETLPTVTIKVGNITIRQDEELPQFEVDIQYNGEKKVILNEETQFTLDDLTASLQQGNGYSLYYDFDTSKEGQYEVKISLESELEHKFNYLWMNKAKVEIINGTIDILNKHGDWEADKFRMVDGTYASGWLNLGEDTYYFDENGERVTGKQQIGGDVYYFTEDGKFDTEIEQVNPNRPMIALTFDDGPGSGTMRLLEVLEKHRAKATFFMVGQNVNQYPDAVKKIYETGCDLGNHTTNHARLTKLAPADITNEIQTTSTWIQNIAGQGSALVRPPYGSVNEVVQANANAPLIMWSVDTMDWKTKNAEAVRNHVLQNVKDGDIVLMHDIHDSTIQAAEMLIPELIEQGYQLVTVSEMARARGVKLENGKMYFHFYK